MEKYKVGRIEVMISEDASFMDLRFTADSHYANREIYWNERRIHNALLTVTKQETPPPGTPPEKLGIKMFVNQVQAAKKLGFKSFDVDAAGSKQSSRYNGYYTWARFGYEPNGWSGKEIAENLQIAGRKEKDLWTLMSTKEGQEWWKEEGESWSGLFYLQEGSRNLQRLKEYAAAQGITGKF